MTVRGSVPNPRHNAVLVALLAVGCAAADPSTGLEPPLEPLSDVVLPKLNAATDPGPPESAIGEAMDLFEQPSETIRPTSVVNQAVGGTHCQGLDEWSEGWESFELEVLARVNLVRAQGATCGGEVMAPTGPLVLHPVLICSARRHSRDMAVHDYFSHINLDEDSPFDRMRAEGYDFRSAAENIAVGQLGPELVMDGWMKSTGHCRNIMQSRYTEIGIGFYLGAEETSGRTLPYWTQNFGNPL